MWRILKRRLGRAGALNAREARQRDWDEEHGEGMWAIGYVVDKAFMLQEDALEHVYHRSYAAHFEAHPADLEELLRTAKTLRNPHARATTGVDLQVPAIMAYLVAKNLTLGGDEVVDIGTWRGEASHALSVRLSPLTVKCVLDPRMTLEKWWQREKCLAVWEPVRRAEKTDSPLEH